VRVEHDIESKDLEAMVVGFAARGGGDVSAHRLDQRRFSGDESLDNEIVHLGRAPTEAVEGAVRWRWRWRLGAR